MTTLDNPAIFNCKHGTCQVNGAFPASFTENLQSLCFKLHELPHDKQGNILNCLPLC